MGKMGGMMGGMMMGKMGMMMGMMMGGMGDINDEAEAVGDPHITTAYGKHYDLEQKDLALAQEAVTAGPMDFIGCFKDDGNRDLNQGPKNYGYNSETCKQACSGYTYFALQNGGWCVCDNAYSTAPQYGQVGDGECGAVCAGEAGSEPPRYCGAGWRNAVYAVADAADDAAAVGDPHMSGPGVKEDLCCEGGECQPCDSSLFKADEDQRPENMCRSGVRRQNICYDARCSRNGQLPGGRNCAALPSGANGCCRSRIQRTCTGPNMDRCRIPGAGGMMGGGMMMGKMGGMMGGMMMGKMGKMGMMMGMMGDINDEAEAVGDPHITTAYGKQYDLQ